MEAHYAKYGVTDGVLRIGVEQKVGGFVCKGWPSWAMAAQARGWIIGVIVVKDNTWRGNIGGWFPKSRIIDYEDWDNESSRGISVDVWFSDIDPPRKLNLWVSNANYIITLRRARRCPSNWSPSTESLSHADCGGVTTGEWTIYIYRRGGAAELDAKKKVAGRDLSTILNTLAQGRAWVNEQAIPTLSREVITLRPNTFHGGGLLPWGSNLFQVVAPCVFSGTGWVKRKLTGSEMLRVLDVPDEMDQDFTSGEIKTICGDKDIIPMKVTLMVIDRIPGFRSETMVSPKRARIEHLEREAELKDPTNDILTDDQDKEKLKDPTNANLDDDQERVKRNEKATRADDAAVPEYLWNDRIPCSNEILKKEALKVIRRLVLRWWNRNLESEFFDWFYSAHPKIDVGKSLSHKFNFKGYAEAKRDWVAGLDCLRRSRGATWWEWTIGSRPYFWRWPREYQEIIRDGLKIWELSPLPKWLVAQRGVAIAYMYEAVRKKLIMVRLKGYLIPGTILSLTSMFAVPKGDTDIRLVYDGTKSGFNKAVWAPWFLLPTIEAHLRSVRPGSYMGDIDMGDMFLNFMMHPKMQAHAGVDLTPFFPEELGIKQTIWVRWGRCGMGFRFSPYQAVQGALFAEEYIRGDPKDPENILGWEAVMLNLPGSESYDPSESWVRKVKTNGDLANDFLIYVDDVRSIGNTLEEARAVARVVASRLTYLGLQDAPRKRRDASQTPGAWAGSIVWTINGQVCVSASQERWDKAKAMIKWMTDSISLGTTINFKQLESHRGFLIYLVRTYPAINPYLKGIHLSLDSWRPWRQDDGWKMTLAEINTAMALKADSHDVEPVGCGEKAPRLVSWVPRFPDDVEALTALFASPTPPQRSMRLSASATAIYQFGDASGSGFGSSLIIDGEVFYRHGQWSTTFSKESSNFRELANLIHAIEDAYDKGLLFNAELFVFTDNSAAEGAFYKGTSPSRKLFDLVLRLRKLQMSGGLTVHVIHVAGKRMIAQGTDGLSRGITTAGVMSGLSFGSFVPLHLDAFQREGSTPELAAWVLGWTGPHRVMVPADWYCHNWSTLTCVWTPPPSAADVCLDMLGKTIHMRPTSNLHVVIVPRLMTSRWRKTLGKICDLVFTVPIGTDIWPSSRFEPLLAGVSGGVAAKIAVV